MACLLTVGRQEVLALASAEVVNLALRPILGLELLRGELDGRLLTYLLLGCVARIVDHSNIF